MTRINVVHPTVLTDQHLMAEYRELTMVMGSLKRSLNSKNGLPPIPAKYTLIAELTDRGYILDKDRIADFSVFSKFLNKDWCADMDAVRINSARIKERIMVKPHWYTYRAVTILAQPNKQDYIEPMLIWA